MIVQARAALPHVVPDREADKGTSGWSGRCVAYSLHRAEDALLEAARAYTLALATRTIAGRDDVVAVAPLALRQRRSATLDDEAKRVADRGVHGDCRGAARYHTLRPSRQLCVWCFQVQSARNERI